MKNLEKTDRNRKIGSWALIFSFFFIVLFILYLNSMMKCQLLKDPAPNVVKKYLLSEEIKTVHTNLFESFVRFGEKLLEQEKFAREIDNFHKRDSLKSILVNLEKELPKNLESKNKSDKLFLYLLSRSKNKTIDFKSGSLKLKTTAEEINFLNKQLEIYQLLIYYPKDNESIRSLNKSQIEESTLIAKFYSEKKDSILALKINFNEKFLNNHAEMDVLPLDLLSLPKHLFKYPKEFKFPDTTNVESLILFEKQKQIFYTETYYGFHYLSELDFLKLKMVLSQNGLIESQDENGYLKIRLSNGVKPTLLSLILKN